jgi:hypothetical protein
MCRACVQLPAPKGAKRKRVPKQQIEIPDDWTQKGMRVVDELLRIPDVKVYFGEPVVPTPTYATDYFNIIKEPMDLSIVRKRLNTGYYVDEAQFKRVRSMQASTLSVGCARVAVLHAVDLMQDSCLLGLSLCLHVWLALRTPFA